MKKLRLTAKNNHRIDKYVFKENKHENIPIYSKDIETPELLDSEREVFDYIIDF